MRHGVMMVAALLGLGLLLPACSRRGAGQSGDLIVASTAFDPGTRLHKRFAKDPEGQNISPPIEWRGAPAATRELVLIVEDQLASRHAESFAHWIVYGIPAGATELPEGIPEGPRTPQGYAQGTNDFGHQGWGGPFPPTGDGAHQYWFWVYALREPLGLAPGATREEVLAAMRTRRLILGNGRLIGTYSR